ncbi:hypothetical protein MASR2M78_23780 [Treponema sp.]
MKKILLSIVVILILPIAAFADWGVGGAAFLKSPVLLGQEIDADYLNVNQFSFGGDLRYKQGWFQAEGLLLYSAGDISSLDAYLDAGVALDLSIARLSIGAGPNFSNNFGESDPIQAGLNAKVSADVVFGPISCGLSYIMSMNLDNGLAVKTGSGLLGASILYWY